jgi:hypothetical protein
MGCARGVRERTFASASIEIHAIQIPRQSILAQERSAARNIIGGTDLIMNNSILSGELKESGL